MPRKIDLTGRKYGKLTVIEELDYKIHNKIAWICKCDCGSIKKSTSGDLKQGKVKTCGSTSCKTYNVKKAHEARRTHNMSNTRIYKIWAGMKRRCNSQHPNYGGRGISYDPNWEQFEPFVKWAINNNYNSDLTIDRIDSNKNYTSSNCRWVNRKAQARNTSTNKMISYNGEVKCLADWAELLNINTRTLYDRIRRGWNIERALTTKAGSYEK